MDRTDIAACEGTSRTDSDSHSDSHKTGRNWNQSCRASTVLKGSHCRSHFVHQDGVRSATRRVSKAAAVATTKQAHSHTTETRVVKFRYRAASSSERL